MPNKNVKTEVSFVETKPAFAIVMFIFIPGSLLRACSPPVQCLNYDDCVEDKREDYQNYTVLYCVSQLYTMIYTHWPFSSGA